MTCEIIAICHKVTKYNAKYGMALFAFYIDGQLDGSTFCLNSSMHSGICYDHKLNKSIRCPIKWVYGMPFPLYAIQDSKTLCEQSRPSSEFP